MNSFKSGVFVQLCGWMGTAPLWTGAVSDTDYNKRAGYLQEQKQFANDDLIEVRGRMGHRVFLNICDKGYRAKLVAHREGGQLVLQPDFAESVSALAAAKHYDLLLWLLIEEEMNKLSM